MATAQHKVEGAREQLRSSMEHKYMQGLKRQKVACSVVREHDCAIQAAQGCCRLLGETAEAGAQV